ncbi:MAG: hypothetical protein WBF53_03240 [Litorimonas sp.]
MSHPDILEQIEADPPNVWLTSFYGFKPDEWGCVGFSVDGQREKYLNATKDGNLIVVYGAKNKETPEDERGRVLGFMQMSRETGHSHQWISLMQIERNKRLGREDKWTNAVRAERAFRLVPEERPIIEDFAPQTYANKNLQHVGSQGVRLLPEEAKRLLNYTFVEQSVFSQSPLTSLVPLKLKSSRGLHAPKQAYTRTTEPDGPKYLYILKLKGDVSRFLGRAREDVEALHIVKVGFLVSPQTRCDYFNNVLPNGAFMWEVLASTNEPFEDQATALAGEDRMKVVLDTHAESLGREFFLAHEDNINEAWFAGKRAALNYRKPA